MTTYGSTYSDIAFPGATGSGGNRWIYASLQTLAHSFTVQYYNKGNSLGTLSVRGSIAQKWRGCGRHQRRGHRATSRTTATTSG